MQSKFHEEIIALTELDEHGVLSFSKERAGILQARFQELLEGPCFAATVDAYVRAVAALHTGRQDLAAEQLMEIASIAVAQLRAKNGPAAEKLKEGVTGAQNLARMKPIGIGGPPDGSVKGHTLIRPMPKPRP